MQNEESFQLGGDVVREIMKSILPEDKRNGTEIFSSWEKITGMETALHVKPRDIVNNVLVLESSHPGWSQKISMMKPAILKKVQKTYPQLEIHDIRVVLKERCTLDVKVSQPYSNGAYNNGEPQ